MNRRRLLAAAGAAPVIGIVRTPVRAATKLRIATPPIPVAGQAYFAQRQGFFEKAGIDADISVMNGGSSTVTAVLGGSLDVGNGNVIAVATAHERGLPLVYVAPDAIWDAAKRPIVGLAVNASSPLKTAKDLNGKTIGVNDLKNLPQLGCMAWIDKNGGDSSTIKWAEIPIPALAAALSSGRVDASFLSDPFLTTALQSGGTRLFANCYEAIAKQFVYGGFFTSAQWAQAHPDVVRSFQTAISEASQWADTHPGEAAAILRDAKLAVNGPQEFPLHLVPAQLQPLVDLAARYGVIRSAFPATEIIVHASSQP